MTADQPTEATGPRPEGRWWLATTKHYGTTRHDVPAWGPVIGAIGGYHVLGTHQAVYYLDPEDVSDLRPAMVVEEPDEAQVRAIVDAHMAEIEAVVVLQREGGGEVERLKEEEARDVEDALICADNDTGYLPVVVDVLAAEVRRLRAVLAAQEREVERLGEALRLIDRHGCENYTGGARCNDLSSGRIRGAHYGADAWCAACVAAEAIAAQRPATPAGDEPPWIDMEWAYLTPEQRTDVLRWAQGTPAAPVAADEATVARVLSEVRDERTRQDARWGEQNHTDGTGGPGTAVDARWARDVTETSAAVGEVTWQNVLHEEVLEAFAEDNPQRLRAELVQVAAVAVAWAEAIDRRALAARPETDGGAA